MSKSSVILHWPDFDAAGSTQCYLPRSITRAGPITGPRANWSLNLVSIWLDWQKTDPRSDFASADTYPDFGLGYNNNGAFDTCRGCRRNTACARRRTCWRWSFPDQRLFRDTSYKSNRHRRHRRYVVSMDRQRKMKVEGFRSTSRRSIVCPRSRDIRRLRICDCDIP